ncbi:MAG: response regulator [bacterium]|nr:response regulator [bacterium]
MRHEPRKRILVVDDEEYICKIIVESLGEENFDIASFTDPREALDYIAANPVDLALTDLVMGQYSGLNILEATLENHPDAIVILMTAHPTVQTAISVLKKGAYDFLVKPFKLELLSATIKRGLAHQKIARDNLSLKGQLEFLKVANAFFGSGLDLDKYLRLVLRSCNTELSARASAVFEIDPKDGSTIRRVHEAVDDAEADAVLDESLIDQFRGSRSSAPAITTEPVEVDGRQKSRILISQPIMIRKRLQGVINVLTVFRSDQIPHGRLDVLSILSNSAASAIANQNLYTDLKRSYLQAIRALASAIEARDVYTAGHTDRVTRLAEQVALFLGWDERRIQTLQVGCTLHDIGKIGVPDAILSKTDRLTEAERKQMNKHPQLGLKIIRGVDLLRPAIPYLASHHERFDGGGYPRGLRGDEIPIEGRVLAVADTFDAIMSDRPYRKGAPVAIAIKELMDNRGTQFDPEIVDAFMEVLRTHKVDLQALYGREEDLSCLDDIPVRQETAPAQTTVPG